MVDLEEYEVLIRPDAPVSKDIEVTYKGRLLHVTGLVVNVSSLISQLGDNHEM